MNRRLIVSSLAFVFALAAVYVGGTGAFFSDTFASNDNVYATEGVTIEMSDISHTYNGTPGPGEPADPTGFVYDSDGTFNFTDLKPLDWGTLDFDILNSENEAYLCGYVTGDVPTETEDIALYDNLQFYNGGIQLVFNRWFDFGVLASGATADYEVDYCFGEPTVNSGGVVGCSVDPLTDYNAAQDAEFSADIFLFAIQTRNNDGFTCDALTYNPDTTTPHEGVDIDFSYLPEAPETLVGASAFTYVAPDSTQCTLTVDENVSPNTSTEFSTLGAAEAAASDGDTICVETGTYEENVTVDVPNVTILGLNDPTGSEKATIDGQITIDVDGVTVRGLEITNEDGSTGLLVRDVDNTEILNNVFVNIGTTLTSGSAQAVYFSGTTGTVGSNGFAVTGNRITGVGNLTKVGPGGSKGIYIGDSDDTGVVTGVVITNNDISNVRTLVSDFGSGGRGSHGILFNYGVIPAAGNAPGVIDGAVISGNTITDIEGYWSRGIGLETDTPNTSITRNDISDIVDHLTATPGDASDGVHFEGNTSGSSVVINENNFADTVGFGVSLNVVAKQPAITVNAENNWWGDTDPSDDILENAGTIDFDPFELAAFANN